MATVLNLFDKSVWSGLVCSKVVTSAGAPAEAPASRSSHGCAAAAMAARADLLGCYDPCHDCPLKAVCDSENCAMHLFPLDGDEPVGSWLDFPDEFLP